MRRGSLPNCWNLATCRNKYQETQRPVPLNYAISGARGIGAVSSVVGFIHSGHGFKGRSLSSVGRNVIPAYIYEHVSLGDNTAQAIGRPECHSGVHIQTAHCPEECCEAAIFAQRNDRCPHHDNF